MVELDGGVDTENDDDLRARILFRIHQPPMGGDADDYVAWALSVPGVTRAWAATEMGIGTVTVRFMMDELRADQDGFPNGDDIVMVENISRQRATGGDQGLLGRSAGARADLSDDQKSGR